MCCEMYHECDCKITPVEGCECGCNVLEPLTSGTQLKLVFSPGETK